MPVAASGHVCSITHDSITPPRNHVRNPGRNLLTAARAQIGLDRLGSRHRPNLPLTVPVLFGSVPARPKAVQIAVIAL
jgi:hypothetical protein